MPLEKVPQELSDFKISCLKGSPSFTTNLTAKTPTRYQEAGSSQNEKEAIFDLSGAC